MKKYKIYVNDRKKTFLSLFRQPEESYSTVETVSEKQNSDEDSSLDLLKTLMSTIFPILTKIRKSIYYIYGLI